MVRAGALLVAVVSVCGVAVGGDLNPPPGAVGATMKTLDQVEAWAVIDPRTAVGDGGAVVLITQPGRYRMVGDIVGKADGEELVDGALEAVSNNCNETKVSS